MLILIFVGDVLTPADVILNTLAMFPVLFAMWTLSTGQAAVVVALTAALLALKAALGAVNTVTVVVDAFACAAMAGLTRIYARAVWRVSTGGQDPTGERRLDHLTRREREVIMLAARGRTAPKIADLLQIGERTVETHLANAYPKLGVRSKLELVKEAANLGV